MSTPHNEAKKGDIAKTVLMPGDPLRAAYIAEHYLEDVMQFNDVRGMLGYTGTYKGKRISVMGSGMGIPSISIYAYELFTEYDVECIMRIGSAGSYSKDVHIRDVVLAMGACTDSNFIHQYDLPGHYSATCNYDLLEKAVHYCRSHEITYHVGNILSTDIFYNALGAQSVEKWASMGVLAVEMESFALYTLAAYLGKKALGIMTISDSLVNDEPPTTPEERETSFTTMMEIALEIAEC
ncbi:MAG: purine-nucleoside phosphorylase [bacterium]